MIDSFLLANSASNYLAGVSARLTAVPPDAATSDSVAIRATSQRVVLPLGMPRWESLSVGHAAPLLRRLDRAGVAG